MNKSGKAIYKSLKRFYICVGIFLFLILIPEIADNIIKNNWIIVITTMAIICFIGVPIAVFLFLYYRNIVVDVMFSGETVEIITNWKNYFYNREKVVKVARDAGKIIIYCKEGQKQRKFVYQTIYFPLKEELPDINYWKTKLTYTEENHI